MPDLRELASIGLRMATALIVGALIGYQRERTGKAAGLRTHMLVALGTAVFVMSANQSGMIANSDAMSRVIQGLATGIGFLGAGAILKLEDTRQIQGLTTAAGIWMTAALSVAAGLGRVGIALIGTGLAWLVLGVLVKAERRVETTARRGAHRATQDPDSRDEA